MSFEEIPISNLKEPGSKVPRCSKHFLNKLQMPLSSWFKRLAHNLQTCSYNDLLNNDAVAIVVFPLLVFLQVKILLVVGVAKGTT